MPRMHWTAVDLCKLSLGFALCVLAALPTAVCHGADELAQSLAGQVTIHRDEWGVPHIEGPTDASVSFGFAYCQAEDYLWQIEDTYACKICGVFVAASARRCDRSDCPQPA